MARYGPLPLDPVIRFWNKVDIQENGCWEWTAAKRRGYGVFALTAQDLRIASRYVWELTYGVIPDGQKVLHGCDNPGCVRPTHLFLGTQADNLWDAYYKGRSRWFGRDEATVPE